MLLTCAGIPDALLTCLQESLHFILDDIYATLGAMQHSHVALCTELLAACLPQAERSSLEALQAAAAFVDQSSSLAPNLNAKLFVSPLVHTSVSGDGTAPGSDGQAMLAEVAAHVTLQTAEGLSNMLVRLLHAAERSGLDSLSWPRASTVRLLAFCKHLAKGPRSGLPERYSQAAVLLPSMTAADICTAVEFVALEGPSPQTTQLRSLGKRVPRYGNLDLGFRTCSPFPCWCKA